MSEQQKTAGYKVVPVEPTLEMDNAARDWAVSKYGRGIGNDAAHGCYSAMLEAAPQPPKLSDDRIREILVNCNREDKTVGDFARAIEREILGGGE